MYHLDEEKDLGKKENDGAGLDGDLDDDAEDNEEELDSWGLEADLEE